MMAGSVLTTLPVLLVFLALQRYYMQGLCWRAASRGETVRRGAAARACSLRSLRRARRCAGPRGWRRRLRHRRGARRFRRPSAWTAGASDGVRASLHAADGIDGRALRLDFDLAGTAGYALADARAAARPAGQLRDHVLHARRCAGQQFPVQARRRERRERVVVQSAEFRLSRASGRRSGSRSARSNSPGGRRQTARSRMRRRSSSSSPPDAAAAAGSIGSAELALRELPPAPPTWPMPDRAASSVEPGADPAFAVDGNVATAWQSDPGAGPAQVLTLDFGQPREFGGLVLHWLDEAVRVALRRAVFGRRRAMADAAQRQRRAAAATMRCCCPKPRARYVRLVAARRPGRGLRPGRSRDQGPRRSAPRPTHSSRRSRASSPRGYFPRGFSGEQSYWTLVGVDGGSDSGLLSEDGALEVAKGGFSIEPFVRRRTRELVTWADVEARQFLRDGYLPMPGVTWRAAAVGAAACTAFASGDAAQSRLVARYELRNLTDRPLPLELVLARPAVPGQPSDAVPQYRRAASARSATSPGTARRSPSTTSARSSRCSAPDAVGAFSFDRGAARSCWRVRTGPKRIARHDAFGYASAALGYQLDARRRGEPTVGLRRAACPAAATPPDLARAIRERPGWRASSDAVAAAWREQAQSRRRSTFPPAAQPLVDALRTALAHMLITRDGPMLRPGTRSYARSWIRDGAMIAESLLRLGHADVAADYLRWYAPHQFANGKVPCCVDERGADPVPGERQRRRVHLSRRRNLSLHAAIARCSRRCGRTSRRRRDYLDDLRRSERTAANLRAGRRAFYGLLPASISHEGYSAKPMHSYWDDFWALKGYDGAIDIADGARPRRGSATRLRRERDEFRARSYRVAARRRRRARHRLSSGRGRAGRLRSDLDHDRVRARAASLRACRPSWCAPTFERYWREFVDRRDGSERGRTTRLTSCAPSAPSCGWAGATGRRSCSPSSWPTGARRRGTSGPRSSAAIRASRASSATCRTPGSPPISSARRSICSRTSATTTMRSCSPPAFPPDWLDGDGIAVQGLRTPYGRLSYSLRRDGGSRAIASTAASRLPPGGFVFVWPGDKPPRSATHQRQAGDVGGCRIALWRRPGQVVIDGR